MTDWLSMHAWTDWIGQQDPGLGLLLMIGGTICLIYGWRLSRFMVAFSLAILAAAAVAFSVPRGWHGIASALAAAVLGAVVGVRWTRLAVALSAGGWSAALIAGAMLRGDAGTGAIMTGSIIAFAAVASMAFAAMRPCVAYVTSVEGTLLFVGGGMIVCANLTTWWGVIRDAVHNNPIFLPFCILAGTVIGYYVQLAAMQEKETGIAVM